MAVCLNTGDCDNKGIVIPLEVAVACVTLTGVPVTNPIVGFAVAWAVDVCGVRDAWIVTALVGTGLVGVSLTEGRGRVDVGGGMVGIVWFCEPALTNAIWVNNQSNNASNVADSSFPNEWLRKLRILVMILGRIRIHHNID